MLKTPSPDILAKYLSSWDHLKTGHRSAVNDLFSTPKIINENISKKVFFVWLFNFRKILIISWGIHVAHSEVTGGIFIIFKPLLFFFNKLLYVYTCASFPNDDWTFSASGLIRTEGHQIFFAWRKIDVLNSGMVKPRNFSEICTSPNSYSSTMHGSHIRALWWPSKKI